jgi:hypothetical protein
MVIRTQYVNVNGTPKVLAKGGGKQRTTAWDLSKSTDWNHGNAAGVLAKVLLATSAPGTADEIEKRFHDAASGAMFHDSNDSGTRHGFKVGE